jgi:hypothetical protein
MELIIEASKMKKITSLGCRNIQFPSCSYSLEQKSSYKWLPSKSSEFDFRGMEMRKGTKSIAF